MYVLSLSGLISRTILMFLLVWSSSSSRVIQILQQLDSCLTPSVGGRERRERKRREREREGEMEGYSDDRWMTDRHKNFLYVSSFTAPDKFVTAMKLLLMVVVFLTTPVHLSRASPAPPVCSNLSPPERLPCFSNWRWNADQQVRSFLRRGFSYYF